MQLNICYLKDFLAFSWCNTKRKFAIQHAYTHVIPTVFRPSFGDYYALEFFFIHIDKVTFFVKNKTLINLTNKIE